MKVLIISVLALKLIYAANICSAQEAVALQGLRLNTLVAGKSTAFRMFNNQTIFTDLNNVEVSIARPDGSTYQKKYSVAEIVKIQTSSKGASIVVTVPGKNLPWVGSYFFKAFLRNGSGKILANYSIDRFQLLPTKDLIVAIDRINAASVNPGTAPEILAARAAMERLASIWPIRDGISTPDGDLTAGLRYVINNKPQTFGCDGNPKHSDCQMCPFFASWQNRKPPLDNMNLGIGFRIQDPGEDMGGIAPNFCPSQSIGWASIVMSGAIAPGFGQESGHVFGLEPANDPHFDKTVQAGHSKDELIDKTDAELGFNIQMNSPFPTQTFDIMHQAVCGCPNDEVSYNSWDWEFLRKQFVKFSSTGPTLPAHFQTEGAPSFLGVGNSFYMFGNRSDGRIFYNRAILGQAGSGWTEMEGNGKTDRSPASGAVGTHLFIAIKGLDGQIYLNQADEGNPFGQWFPMNFKTDVAPCLVGIGKSIFMFAKGLDQKIYLNQAVLGSGFSGWFEVQGNGRTDASPSAGVVNNHVFVAIKGLDGKLYLNQADFGHAFGQWFPLNFNSNVAPGLVGVQNSIFVFAKGLDERIYLSQAEIGHKFSGWFEVQGNGKTNLSPTAAAIKNHVFVGIKGLNNLVRTNQADFGHAFGQWVE